MIILKKDDKFFVRSQKGFRLVVFSDKFVPFTEAEIVDFVPVDIDFESGEIKEEKKFDGYLA